MCNTVFSRMLIWNTTTVFFAVAVCYTNSELISIAAGSVALLGSGLFVKFRKEIRCSLYECCDRPYINPDFNRLKTDLGQFVFGQHLETVYNAIMSHYSVTDAKKPLVLSFHGYTGSGKNHVSRIIINNIFKNGMKSSFVHHIVATSEYPDKSRIEEYQLKLHERILAAVSKCERSIFIFDEIDKLPEQLLGAIKPFLDYYDSVQGVDFRRTIFIFLSNRGGNAIANLALQQHQSGKNRDELDLQNFEGVVMQEVFNSEGGLQMSELISNHLIDHFIPFLPLERQHVVLCTHEHLRLRGFPRLISDRDLVNRIVDSLQYFPKGSGIFSSSGCKRIAQKADLELNKLQTSINLDIDHLSDDDFSISDEL